MVQFAHKYADALAPSATVGQPPVVQLPAFPNGPQLVAQIPWAHNVLLIQRVKEPAARLWYMQQTLANGWSRNVLLIVIELQVHVLDVGEHDQGLVAMASIPAERIEELGACFCAVLLFWRVFTERTSLGAGVRPERHPRAAPWSRPSRRPGFRRPG
jgi:DUF1016 N-terminal domain